jgi:hypothetical protein
MLATPALGQDAAPVSAPARAQGTASTPDFFGVWSHPSFPWYEPPASGPGPVTNRSRWPYIVNQRPSVAGGSPGLAPSKDGQGVSDYDQLVGDYTNPILQPWAAEVVKKFGEISLAGITYPNPSNQCWPEPVPFIFKRVQMQMIQQVDKITILYGEDHEVRWGRLNQPHPRPVTPSWHGDSVGHYEGDTLVIDTKSITLATSIGSPWRQAWNPTRNISLKGIIFHPKGFLECWFLVEHNKDMKANPAKCAVL